jgi:hypothetical protein
MKAPLNLNQNAGIYQAMLGVWNRAWVFDLLPIFFIANL